MVVIGSLNMVGDGDGCGGIGRVLGGRGSLEGALEGLGKALAGC